MSQLLEQLNTIKIHKLKKQLHLVEVVFQIFLLDLLIKMNWYLYIYNKVDLPISLKLIYTMHKEELFQMYQHLELILMFL